MTCEDSFDTVDLVTGRLFYVFDGMSFGTGGFNVAQHVYAKLPPLAHAKLDNLHPFEPKSAGKRARSASEKELDRTIIMALDTMLLELDDILFDLGHRADGGSIICLFICTETLKAYSIVVGDCEGAAFSSSRRIVQKFAPHPHNVNSAAEQNYIQVKYNLPNRNFAEYDQEDSVYRMRGLQTTRFLGAWDLKAQCCHADPENRASGLCNAPLEKGQLYCNSHRHLDSAVVVRYWNPDVQIFPLTSADPDKISYDFFVFASDGLWDTMSTDRACEIVANLKPKDRAQDLGGYGGPASHAQL